MENIKISLDVTNPSQFHNIGIELWLDQQKFFDNTVSPGRHHVIHEFESADQDHFFKIVLKNKTHEHTKIDDEGNIISDTLINVSNVCFDEINIDDIIYVLADYVHDNNGSSVPAVHDFFGDLGCNGQVQFKFSTPVYLWLIDNM
jgi:hypothetical protein